MKPTENVGIQLKNVLRYEGIYCWTINSLVAMIDYAIEEKTFLVMWSDYVSMLAVILKQHQFWSKGNYISTATQCYAMKCQHGKFKVIDSII